MMQDFLFKASNISKYYGQNVGCKNVSLDINSGEVLGIVGESGSGKSTLLNCIYGNLEVDEGDIFLNDKSKTILNFTKISEPKLRLIQRSDLAFVHQNPRDGLRMNISAGGNIGERLMAIGHRNYGEIREIAANWLEKVEIDDLEKIYPKASKLYSEDSDFNLKAQNVNKQLNEKKETLIKFNLEWSQIVMAIILAILFFFFTSNFNSLSFNFENVGIK